MHEYQVNGEPSGNSQLPMWFDLELRPLMHVFVST